MLDTTVRLTGNGYTVTLTDTAKDLHRKTGGGGWGMVPVVNSWFEGAGDGARHRGVRRTQRELKIPIDAFGANRAAVEQNIRNLVRVVRGDFQVHVDRLDGSSYWIAATYDSGLEGVYTVAPEQWADATIILKCPDPYWTSDASQSFVIAPAPADAPFLPELAGMHVASAAAFGEVGVTNTGDVESRPTWTINGPGTSLELSIGGEGLVLNKTLTSADVVTIQYAEGGWTITDQTGENLYPYLTGAPVFPVIPAGGSVVSASMADSGIETYIQCVYPERREVMY